MAESDTATRTVGNESGVDEVTGPGFRSGHPPPANQEQMITPATAATDAAASVYGSRARRDAVTSASTIAVTAKAAPSA